MALARSTFSISSVVFVQTSGRVLVVRADTAEGKANVNAPRRRCVSQLREEALDEGHDALVGVQVDALPAHPLPHLLVLVGGVGPVRTSDAPAAPLHLLQEAQPPWRWRRNDRPTTSPDAMFSAANSDVVPCLL